MTVFSTPIDREYYDQKTEREQSVHPFMDRWYQSNGFEIVDREGTRSRDLLLRRCDNNAILKVEEKFRDVDYGDLLVEIIQDLVSLNKGWFYAEKFDRLAYVILDDNGEPKTIYWLKFNEFRNWYFRYLARHKHPKAMVCPDGYGLTLNLLISWREIDASLYQKYELRAVQ